MLPFRVLFHPEFTVDLGPHVFPAQKYQRVRDALLSEGIADASDFLEPSPATDDDLLRVHTADYVRKAKSGAFTPMEAAVLEVPWSPSLARAKWLAAGATLEAARLARADGCTVVLGGGFHHAFADHGEGFCLVNDVAVAAAALRSRGEARRIAIVDLDVHHGNGTAALLGHDPDTFTVSLHQEHNYPHVKPASRVDVGLPDGTTDEEYLAALQEPLRQAIDFRPEALFFLAGADPYEGDLLGGLALTVDGLAERDRRVLSAARDARVPVVVTLAGGYAADTRRTVEIHVNTVRVAAGVFG